MKYKANNDDIVKYPKLGIRWFTSIETFDYSSLVLNSLNCNMKRALRSSVKFDLDYLLYITK